MELIGENNTMDVAQYIAEAGGLVEKWSDTLLSEDAPKIRDSYRLAETARMLERQHIANREFAQNNSMLLAEDAANTVTANVARWDPVLVSMVRRAAPVLLSFDFGSVQTMSMPTGLVFSLSAHYTGGSGAEALFDEANTAFSGTGTHAGDDPFLPAFSTGRGMPTSAAEGDISATMSFVIDKISVEAKSRQLAGSYSIEVQQDMRAVHNLDADTELANIMSMELLAEQNREFARTLWIVSRLGAQNTGRPGVFDVDSDADGRWSVEKNKGIAYQIAKEATQIYFATRRGLGNKVLATADVITALYMAGVLDTGGTNPLAAEMGGMDPAMSSYVGRLLGRYDVHLDPYLTNVHGVLVGYRGVIPWDAGLYWCPYTPFELHRAIDPKSFVPKLGYKTRYGIVSNPWIRVSDGGPKDGMNLTARRNDYFRSFRVTGI